MKSLGREWNRYLGQNEDNILAKYNREYILLQLSLKFECDAPLINLAMENFIQY